VRLIHLICIEIALKCKSGPCKWFTPINKKCLMPKVRAEILIIGFSSINSSISARPPPPPKERSEMERVTFWTFGLFNYLFNIYIKYNTYYIRIYYIDLYT